MYRVEVQEDGSYLIVNRDDPSETYVWQPGKNLPDHVMQALIEYLSGTPEQAGPDEVPAESPDPFGQTSRWGGRQTGGDNWWNLNFKNQLGGGSSTGGKFGNPEYLNFMRARHAQNYPDWAGRDYYFPEGVPSTLADLTPEEEERLAAEEEAKQASQAPSINQAFRSDTGMFNREGSMAERGRAAIDRILAGKQFG